MVDRFSRATYKNLLGGGVGSINIQQQQTQQQLTNLNGDENVHLLVNNVKNLKTATSISNGLSNLNGPNMISLQSFSSTNVYSSHIQLNQQQQSQQQVNSTRNALGDIGNRIAVTNNQFIAKKEILKASVPNYNTDLNIEKISTQNERNHLQVQTSSTNNLNVLSSKIEPVTINNINSNDKSMNDSSIMECTPDIIDIDEFDAENPQLVSEYVKDIYSYLNHMEKRFRISPNFLENKIVTSKMRSVLIDWLIQVHLKFHLLQETLYLCVQIIDAYLQAQDVPKMQLQLVGVTAMFLASKYEEMYVPAIDDFVYMTDNTYTRAEIRQMEIDILKTLDFMFGKPLPLHFLRRFSKAGQADPKQHTLAKYFMELSLHDAEFSSFDPSYLAACSLSLSFKLLKGSEWNRTMEFYSTYKQDALWPGMQKLAKLIHKSSDLDYKYRAATNKYGTSKFMRISLIPELNNDFMKDLILGKWPQSI